MDFVLLINRHNDPAMERSRRMVPKEYETPHKPVKISLDVHPAIAKSIELARACFPERYDGLPVIMYDTSHHGEFAGFVVPYEEFKDEDGVNSKLEARISFEGKANEKKVVSHTDLSRVHLGVYAIRSFPPKGYRTSLKSVPAKNRDKAHVSESVNVSFRWVEKKGFKNLNYQAGWNLPETFYGESFEFHKTRSTYCVSFCNESSQPITKRRTPLLPLSPTLDCLPSGKGFDEFKKFVSRKLEDSQTIPSIGISAVQKAFPNFPEPPRKLVVQYGFPTPDEAPDYLFGAVLPYLKRFINFEI